jgi:hypothetical protein
MITAYAFSGFVMSPLLDHVTNNRFIHTLRHRMPP